MKRTIYFVLIIIIIVVPKSVSLKHQNEDEPIANEGNDDNELDPTNLVNFVGSNLFRTEGPSRTCFSPEEVAMLQYRMQFERLIPKELPKFLFDDKLAQTLIQYFSSASQVVSRSTTGSSKNYARSALYDALGGFLNYYVVPVTKASFYAGTISLRAAEDVFEIFKQCKSYLNTNGNGWEPAINDLSDIKTSSVEPLHITAGKNDHKACTNLYLIDEKSSDDDMIVALPKLEPSENGKLSNIWLPFKRKRSFNLRSRYAAFVVLQYYVFVSRCHQFQGISQDAFNKQFVSWIHENIEEHLNDEILYPGLGAVLRILKSIKHNKNDYVLPKVIILEENTMNIDRKKLKKKQKSELITKTNSKKAIEKHTPTLMDKIFGHNANKQSESQLEPITLEYDDEEDGDDDFTKSAKARRRAYISIAIVVSALLVAFIIVVGVLTKCMTKRKSCDNISKKSQPKSRKRFLSFFCCKKKQKKDDEEIVLHSKSNSIMSGKSKTTGASSGSGASKTSAAASKASGGSKGSPASGASLRRQNSCCARSSCCSRSPKPPKSPKSPKKQKTSVQNLKKPNKKMTTSSSESLLSSPKKQQNKTTTSKFTRTQSRTSSNTSGLNITKSIGHSKTNVCKVDEKPKSSFCSFSKKKPEDRPASGPCKCCPAKVGIKTKPPKHSPRIRGTTPRLVGGKDEGSTSWETIHD